MEFEFYLGPLKMPNLRAIESILFKTHFKRNLSLFALMVGPSTVMSKAGSINPLLSSSIVC